MADYTSQAHEKTQEDEDTERVFGILGMDCPNCALTLERGMANLEGVRSAEVLFSMQKMKIVGDAAEQEIITQVRKLGYDVEKKEESAKISAPQNRGLINFWNYLWTRSDARLFFAGLVFILPGLILEELLGVSYWAISLSSVIAVGAAGLPVFRSAWRSIRLSREININVLMSVAGIGAILIGAYTEAGMVMVLFLLGEILEGYSAERSRREIRSLIQLVSQEATRVVEEKGKVFHRRVAVSDLMIGDHIMVKPGEKIPMDGIVLSGSSSVNQASITGESQPVEKFPDSQVFASSINGEGSLEIKVSHLAADNTISRLIRMVEEAQEKRAPAQRFIDRFAKFYTPIVVGVALLVMIIPPLVFHQPLLNPDENTFGWLYRGLALLVVGCPCALVISTPVSLISAISNAAQHGILIKGGAHLEVLSHIKVMAFDKTGTLTTGKPAVVSVRASNCKDRLDGIAIRPLGVGNDDHFVDCQACSELVAIAGAVERYSEHPLAGAIVNKAIDHDLLERYPAIGVSALAGRGVKGIVNGQEVIIGSHKFFDDTHPHLEQYCEEARIDAAEGITPLMVSQDEAYMGTISVADGVRASSRAAVDLIRKNGIHKVFMLTGDDKEVARGIAQQVGVNEFRAQLLPEEKVKAIDEIRRQYGKVAMVGDGINDSPALATADVGIAIGGAYGGSAQAMETADVTLMSDDLRRLVFLLHLSNATMNTIYFNVTLAILVKLVFFALVLLGHGTMWMAVFADMGTSLLVTSIGLRLLRHPVPAV